MYKQPQELYHSGVKGMKWGIRKEVDQYNGRMLKVGAKNAEYGADYNASKRNKEQVKMDEAKFKSNMKKAKKVTLTAITTGLLGAIAVQQVFKMFKGTKKLVAK